MQSSLGSLTGGSLASHWTLRACPSLPPALLCPRLMQPHPDHHHRLSDPPRGHMLRTVNTCSLLPPYLGRMDIHIPAAGLLSLQAPATAPALQAGTLLLPPGLDQTLAMKKKTSACLSACLRDSRFHSQRLSMVGRPQQHSSRQ